MSGCGGGGKFSIDDAFQSDEEDPIRIYGATNESAPLRAKRYSQKCGETPATIEVSREQIPEHDIGSPPTATPKPYTSILRTVSAHSFSSTSDSASVMAKTFPAEKRWWRHPKVRDNWKIVLASFILLVMGLVLIVVGIGIEASHTTVVQSFIFFIAGVICLIPGAYHVVYIYCAVRGKRGFDFYHLPVFR